VSERNSKRFDERALSKSAASDLLRYEPSTGNFYWLKRTGPRSAPGELAGYVTSDGHRRITVAGTSVWAHRLAWFLVHGAWPTGEIDHINGDKLDNRIENLRDVTRALNQQNQRAANKGSRTGMRGVSITPAGRFQARHQGGRQAPSHRSLHHARSRA
jgi:hypothetical protein